MPVEDTIDEYIASQPEPKRTDVQNLHRVVLKLMPGCKLWFLDGKNDEGKVISNPSIGYGSCILRYANGNTKEFYKIGISANNGGISVYIFGIEDKQ